MRVTKLYESTKDAMIESKRNKQDILDKIVNVERMIREKNQLRDANMLTVKQCQLTSQERWRKDHDDLMKLEEDIYTEGCRLETIEHENERFEQVNMSHATACSFHRVFIYHLLVVSCF
jgi:hypothetical protein